MIAVSVEEREGFAEVIVRGRLTMSGVGHLTSAVSDAIRRGHRLLVLNMRETEFMDSSGLGAMVGCLKAAREAGGDLRLGKISDQVGAVLVRTNVDRVFAPHLSGA
ncbi:STAS domain-containing protein [Sinomonas sp.]|jgi:anti-sigma B factor antagonist|uniref:STAS domain-containing protein n=1 Tax=Sinomonas sp. TaxID=1914986 RepID=UPI003F81FBBB